MHLDTLSVVGKQLVSLVSCEYNIAYLMSLETGVYIEILEAREILRSS